MDNGPIVVDGNPIHISRISSKLKISQTTIPKILLSKNNYDKRNIKNTKTNNAIGDFENILDIPIIFARDDDNLTALEQIPTPLIDINSSKVVDKNLTGKMVLLNGEEEYSVCNNQVVTNCEGIKIQNINRSRFIKPGIQNLLPNVKHIGNNTVLHSSNNKDNVKTIGDLSKCTKIVLTKKKS